MPISNYRILYVFVMITNLVIYKSFLTLTAPKLLSYLFLSSTFIFNIVFVFVVFCLFVRLLVYNGSYHLLSVLSGEKTHECTEQRENENRYIRTP